LGLRHAARRELTHAAVHGVSEPAARHAEIDVLESIVVLRQERRASAIGNANPVRPVLPQDAVQFDCRLLGEESEAGLP
jgi:hypothetical protein